MGKYSVWFRIKYRHRENRALTYYGFFFLQNSTPEAFDGLM